MSGSPILTNFRITEDKIMSGIPDLLLCDVCRIYVRKPDPDELQDP
jgi:hypothetical protein